MTTNNAINNLPIGMVLQTVSISGGGSATSSATYVDITGSSITITPTSSSSLILIMMTCGVDVPQAANSIFSMRCIRGAATVIGADPLGVVSNQVTANTGGVDYTPGFMIVDNPGTTSSTTYKFQQKQAGTVTVTTSNLNAVVMELSGGILTNNAINNASPGDWVQYQYENGGGSTTNSATFVDVTNFTATITPTSASNKVLVLAYFKTNIPAAVGNTAAYYALFRDVTNIIPGGVQWSIQFGDQSTGNIGDSFNFFAYLDSPATTSATVYKWQHKQSGTVTITTSPANLLLAEIKV